MKYLYLLLMMLWGTGSQTLNVIDYGATGGGIVDDTNAINTCLAAAHTQAKSVYFPPGTYLCNTIDGQGNVLTFDASGISNTTIYGKGAILKTTNNAASTLLYVFAFANQRGLTISGLNFLNTHGKMNGVTQGLFLQGIDSMYIDTVLVTNNTFAGFSVGMGAQGVTGLNIISNTFNAPHGHDDAQQNTEPAVNIWLSDNSNGYCEHINIQQNIGRGYTGPIPLNCLRPMDGFLYGTGHGYHVWGNDLKWYSEELIYIMPPGPGKSQDSIILVENNSLDCSLPPGSLNDDSTKHKGNYGIRIDISNATVQNNNIFTCTWGFMTRGIDFPTLTFHDISYINNNLYAATTDTANYSYQRAIFIQGSGSFPIPGIRVTGNTIHLLDTVGVQILNSTAPVNFNNYYSPAN